MDIGAGSAPQPGTGPAGQSQGSGREARRQVPRRPVRLQPDLEEVVELCIAPVDERRRVAEAGRCDHLYGWLPLAQQVFVLAMPTSSLAAEKM